MTPELRRQRLVYIGIGIAVLIFWLLTRPKAAEQTPAPVSQPPAATAPAPGPAAAAPATRVVQAQIPTPAETSVDIVDGMTLDFSGGRPAMRDSSADQAAMNAALKDIEDATRDVRFPSSRP